MRCRVKVSTERKRERGRERQLKRIEKREDICKCVKSTIMRLASGANAINEKEKLADRLREYYTRMPPESSNFEGSLIAVKP